MTDIEQQLFEQFAEKYISGNHVERKYNEKGVGAKDVNEYPDTPLHRELYPELYNFKFYYFSAHIKRNWSHSWCGYVKTDANHPIWKFKDPENESDIQVHGGLTYSSNRALTVGFDCSHYNDENPFSTSSSKKVVYRDREYVINELKNLCLQLYQMLSKWRPQTHFQFPKEMRERFFSIYCLFYLRKQSEDLSKILEKDIWIKIIADSDQYIGEY